MLSKKILIFMVITLLFNSCEAKGEAGYDGDYTPEFRAMIFEVECLLTPECLVFRYLLENEENEKCKKSGEWIVLNGGSMLIKDFCANNRKYNQFHIEQGEASQLSNDPNYVVPGNFIYFGVLYKMNKPFSEISNGDIFYRIDENGPDSRKDEYRSSFYIVGDDENITFAKQTSGRGYSLLGVKK